ncbi:DUF3846 domain-containing protein [Nonomuraea basaltis]|uniref:DUF3846 domain-containing protein n=1 Tax=Nonomuraea basaltis TaxID=2495887 RepID=UPI0014862285|nr:DUF3846 domain-containing protein [Nonomuraea basaltis]
MSSASAYVLHPDGDLLKVNLPDNGHDRLHTMYKVLGCSYVDVVRLTDNLDMWLDDMGLYDKTVNMPATMLARRFGKVWQPYFGPVLLCSVDDEGNSIDLTEDQAIGLLTALLDISES